MLVLIKWGEDLGRPMGEEGLNEAHTSSAARAWVFNRITTGICCKDRGIIGSMQCHDLLYKSRC